MLILAVLPNVPVHAKNEISDLIPNLLAVSETAVYLEYCITNEE